jgi:hypothetical protein
MRLLFENPVMRAGLNITVRRGDKWLGYMGHSAVARTEDGPVLGDVIVMHTLRVDRFCDLNGNDQLLRLEHDPSCQEYRGLAEAMRGEYPGFDVLDPVTVVFFISAMAMDCDPEGCGCTVCVCGAGDLNEE